MFTGIIEETGKVKSVRQTGSVFQLEISAKTVLKETKPGDSICVNGVCLTVILAEDLARRAGLAVDNSRLDQTLNTPALATLLIPHRLRDHPQATSLVQSGTSVAFENINFCYPDGRHVFADFSLRIEPGQHVEVGAKAVPQQAEHGDPAGSGDRAWIAPDNTSLTEFRFAPNPYENKATLPVQLVRYNDHAHLGALERQPHSI